MKAVLRRVLGPSRMGWLDYYRFPGQRDAWGGPLNGQEGRRETVEALLAALPFAAILETGTFRGVTTAYLAGRTQVPVHTVEADAHSFGFARAHLRRHPHVAQHLGDSRSFLRERFQNPAMAASSVFVYLDAHWHDDLPLAEELEITFAACPRAVVMIDDFQVPDDPGYRYDDYGPGEALSPDYIESAVRRFGLLAWYPARPSREETGQRRGAVVLARDPDLARELDRLPGLRRESR